MNSILRQSHIRSIDLRDFLRNYDASNTTAVSIWAKAACARFEPGSLIFIVEPVTLPFGLISFVRKEEEDNFRVTDLVIVVRIEDNKAMAVSLTNNTYELRFLEALLEEKARKAIIDRKRFSFVAARPYLPLALTKFQELERLSNIYAKGGSRRTFMNTNAQGEPAIALLSACGVHLSFTSVNKQPIDIGSICFSLFNSDTKQPDNNRSQLKDNFVPVPSDFSDFKTITTSSEEDDASQSKNINLLLEKSTALKSTEVQDNSGFNLLQSWGGSGQRRDFTGDVSSFEQFAKEPFKEEIPREESNSSTEKVQNANTEYTETHSEDKLQVPPITTDAKIEINDSAPGNADTKSVPFSSMPEDVYKHLSEAITDLLVPQQSTSEPTDKGTFSQTAKIDHRIIKPKEKGGANNRKWPAAISFDKLPAFEKPITLGSVLPSVPESENLPVAPELEKPINPNPDVSTVPRSDAALPMPTASPVSEESSSASSTIASEPPNISQPDDTSVLPFPQTTESETGDKPIILKDESSHSFIEPESFDLNTEERIAIFPSVDMMPSKLDDFQEPKVVMNEMASLMSKLESQVARAAKKLAAKASEIEKHLTTNLDAQLNLINQEDKNGYAELVVRIDLLSKQFESLFDTLKTELAEKAAGSREQIKSRLTGYQEKTDKTENEQRDNLIQEFKQNKTQFDYLVQDQESELNKLVSLQIELLNNRIILIDQILEDSSVNLGTQLDQYFNNFKECVDDRVLTLLKAFDHHLDILYKDIERLHIEGTEQLSLAKKEFFSKLDRLIQITEIALSRQVRKIQTESFLPKLKERKQIIEAMMHEMTQIFAEHSFSQAKAQSEGAEHSLILARQQLKELVDERLSKLDVVGRNQQNGLEEIFKSAADPLEQNTATVVQLLKQAEQEINECEAVCTKLAQSYNLDNDPKLTTLRQDVYGKVDALKAQLKNNLESVLENSCLKLEDTTKNYHIKLNTKRAELAQQVRSASDQGLQNIRQAIHDAFHAVQSEREKYME